MYHFVKYIATAILVITYSDVEKKKNVESIVTRFLNFFFHFKTPILRKRKKLLRLRYVSLPNFKLPRKKLSKVRVIRVRM